MKKKILIVIGVLSLFLFLFPESKVSASVNNKTQNLGEKTIEFSELSEEQQTYFLYEGFDENNQYFQQTIIQQPATEGTLQQRVQANVLFITGSTKKITSTSAYTSYVINSSNAPILRTDTRVTLNGYKSFSSSVIPYNSPYVSSGGIYSSYTGAEKYFSVSLASQITTTKGPGAANCRAGGVTLGN